MDCFGMVACCFEPVADGLSLHIVGVFDGDGRTAPTDQGKDLCNDRLVGTATMKDRTGARIKAFATDRAPIPLFLLLMHADVAPANMPPSGQSKSGTIPRAG